MRRTGARRTALLVCASALVLMSALPYAFSLGGEFVLDDRTMILHDDVVHSLRSIPKAFTQGFLRGFDPKPHYYRPLITVSYALDYAISGTNPVGYRVSNLLMHVTVTLLVFALAGRVIQSRTAAFAAALLFGVHPAHTEAVVWICARTELVMAVLGLASLLAFARYAERGGRGWHALSVGFFLAALLSKESAIVVPVLAAALAVVLRPKVRARQVLIDVLPFVATIIIYLVVRRLVLGYTVSQSPGLLIERRIFFAPYVMLQYLRILILPSRAEPLYDVLGTAIRTPAIAVGAWVLIGGLFAGAFAFRRKFPAARLGVFWTLVALVPVSNFVPIPGPLPCERFLYLPSVGFSLLFGLAAAWALRIRPRPLSQVWPTIVGAALAGALAYCAIQTYSGAAIWSSDVALLTRMIERGPRFGDIHLLAAKAYEARGDIERAIKEYEEAARILPDDPSPRRALGVLYRKLGNGSAAVREARVLVRLLPNDGTAHNVLGAALAQTGVMTAAIRAFERAARLAPHDSAIRFNLARACARNGDFARAVEEYRNGLKLRPDDERARYELGLALREAGKIDKVRER